uniref:Peptidase A2 domain-containing protein n=1 Tax=Lutzomyia longipalpis TaxID=7200 RepID=A0A1B0CVT7_LUTLO
MSEVRRAAVNSRSGYKAKATRVKKVVERYTNDASLFELPTAFPEIEHNLNLLPELRMNLERIQDTIVRLTEDQDEVEEELENFLIFMESLDECEQSLIDLRKRAKGALKTENPTTGYMEVLTNTMKEIHFETEVERQVVEERHKADRESKQRKFETAFQVLATGNNFFEGSAREHPTSNVKLSPLTVPEFDGQYSAWMGFKDLFTTVVDKNQTLNDCQKLYYLHSFLKGEAKAVVEHLPLTSANYVIAWNLLVDRYDNPMSIAMSHIRKFMNVPRLSEPTPEAIRKTQTAMSSAVQAIDALGMKQRDIWLISFALERLDDETIRLWSRVSYNTTPTWKEFNEFLVERYKTMEIATAGNQLTIRRKAEMNTNKHIVASNWSSNVAQGSSSTSTNQIKSELEEIENAIFINLATIDTATISDNSECNLTSTTTSGSSLRNTVTASHILLATAVIRVQDAQGDTVQCRALLDCGAQANIITEKLCQRLKLPKRKTNCRLKGIGSPQVLSQHQVSVAYGPWGFNSWTTINCFVQPTLLNCSPQSKSNLKQFQFHPTLSWRTLNGTFLKQSTFYLGDNCSGM